MPRKVASARVKANVSPKAASASRAKARKKAVRLSKVEAERLERFKTMMQKYRGKATFAGFDE